MTDSQRRGGGGGAGVMAVTEVKQGENNNGINNNNGEYWNDVNNQLSPVRKHLINTYLQIQDDEALPLLGEYFGVALSFMALGALVRASNSSKKRRKSTSDEERLDLRACSRFQRMALESMLKEAMERLRGLAQNAYQTEERMRDLVEAEVEMDKEKIALLIRVADAEKAVSELKGLRKAEGRANERVMSIVAAKEQDWLKEKRSLQKEIERLKENLNTVCREVKFQSRRCRSPTCEHCKGIERVVRNVRGRVSLRELNYRETSAHVPSKRDVAKVEQPPAVEEVEEERVLIKAMEQKKKKSEQPGHLQVQTKVEKHVEWTAASSSVNPSGGSAGGAGQSMCKQLIAKQQQDMESELANILKRVGMLKQRSHSSGATSTEQLSASLESKNVATSSEPIAPVESKSFTLEEAETVNIFSGKVVSELLKDEALVEKQAPSSFVPDDVGQNFELADDLTTGLLTLEQEALLSVEEDPDLLELEKAFEFQGDVGTAGPADNVMDASGGGNQQDVKSLADASPAMTTEEERILFYEDCEIAELESRLSSDAGVASLVALCQEADKSKDFESKEVETSVILAPDSISKEVSLSSNAGDTDVLESEFEIALNPSEATTNAPRNEDHVLIVTAENAVNESSGKISSTDGDGGALDEAVLEVEDLAIDEVQESLGHSERQDTPGEVENFEQTDLSTDAGSREPVVSGELSEPLDRLDDTIIETPSQSDQGSPADSSCVENDSGILSQDVLDGEEPTLAQDDLSEVVSERSASPLDEDKPLPEDVKVVDAGDSPEPEQVLEMVEVDSGTALSERQDPALEGYENVDSSAADTDSTEHDQDGVATGEKSDIDAEIPVFERAGSEDLAGELPEPDEKRVCDSGEPDVDVAGNADSADVLSLEGSLERSEEGENKKVDDLVAPGDDELTTQFESVVDPVKLSFDQLEEMNLVKDNSSLQQEESTDVLVEVDSALGGE